MATTVENPFDTQQTSTSGIVNKAIDTSTAGNTVAQYTPETRSVDAKTQTSAGQVESLLSKDSPLLQRARTLAMQGMAQRGLVNSSMAQGAGTAAMIDKITPIAQQDAKIYNDTASENMAAKNTAGITNVTEQNKFGLQVGEQKFESGEAQKGREFTTSERVAGQKFTTDLEVAKQKFTAAQADLDRAEARFLQDDSQEAQTNLELAKQKFASSEAVLDRLQQTNLQNDAQDFTKTENAADRTQQTNLQNDSQDFTKSESALSRQAAADLQNDEQAYKVSEAALDRTFKQTEAALDRTQATALQNDQQLFTETLNNSNIPKNFASELTKSVTTSVNAIAADPNLSGTADGYIDPVTKKFVAGAVPKVGYMVMGAFVAGNPPKGAEAVYVTPSSPKSRAISSTLNYANTQIEWANKFYGTSIPVMSTTP